ncbi:hypothetical protein L195_g025574 [Trifolium pratense]|uniref:Uncharacterized protein n=1 Tax=Trifolium pratense TaxID=57577 RepID=A0A2K3NGX9_TRIPR|nr:hypothetical protein L195_g025574 [Trifolium pratense]
MAARSPQNLNSFIATPTKKTDKDSEPKPEEKNKKDVDSSAAFPEPGTVPGSSFRMQPQSKISHPYHVIIEGLGSAQNKGIIEEGAADNSDSELRNCSFFQHAGRHPPRQSFINTAGMMLNLNLAWYGHDCYGDETKLLVSETILRKHVSEAGDLFYS